MTQINSAEFKKAANLILDKFAATITKPKDLIFHYTNDIGLKGILESGQLRMTDINSLNDPSELRHGLFRAKKIFDTVELSEPFKTQVNKYTETIGNEPLEFGRDKFNFVNMYTCSFSLDGNDLGQWRAYANNGCGFALGFDADALEEIFLENFHREGTNTFPVQYKEALLEDIFKKLIDTLKDFSLKLPKQKSGGFDTGEVTEIISQFILFTIMFSLHFKHEAYRNEVEYRFLQWFGNDQKTLEQFLKYQVRSNELYRHIEFPWNTRPSVLKRIVIGPAADPIKAMSFVNDCLKTYHADYANVEITDLGESKIPYRAL